MITGLCPERLYALLADCLNANHATDLIKRPVQRPSLRVDVLFEHGEFYCKSCGADARLPRTVPVATQMKPTWESETRMKNDHGFVPGMMLYPSENNSIAKHGAPTYVCQKKILATTQIKQTSERKTASIP